jgi:hypothetical protein
MIQDGFDPLEILESVEIRYHQYEQCHKVTGTPESIGELKKWRDQELSQEYIYLHEAHAAALEAMVFPKHGTRFTTPFIGHLIKILDLEREYRRAVVAQQAAVKNATRWQADTLPVGNI